MWDFSKQFLIDNDAFDPGIDAEDSFPTSVRRGGRYKLRNPHFILSVGEREVTSTPELTRVDYFKFGN